MTTLLDTINNNIRTSANLGPEAGGISDQTSQVQRLARAKGGKAVAGGSTPRLSNVQEQVAAANTRANLGQVSQEAGLKAEAADQQQAHFQQQAEQANKQIDAERLKVQETYANQADAILKDLTRNTEELNFRKDAARVEQAGFLIRLQNDQYLDTLNNEAARAQLDNELSFREELTRTIFEEEEELFRNDLRFRSLMNADARSFNEEMGNIDLNFALEMAEAQARQANEQLLWSGIGNVASGAISAWDTAASNSNTPKITNTTELAASNNPISNMEGLLG